MITCVIDATPKNINNIPQDVEILNIFHNDNESNEYVEIFLDMEKNKNVILNCDIGKDVNDMYLNTLDYSFLNKLTNLKRLRVYAKYNSNCFLYDIKNGKIKLPENLEILICSNRYDFDEEHELLKFLDDLKNLKVLFLDGYYDDFFFKKLPSTLEMIILSTEYKLKQLEEFLEKHPSNLKNLKTIYVCEQKLNKEYNFSPNIQIVCEKLYNLQKMDIMTKYFEDYKEIKVIINSEYNKNNVEFI